MAWHEEPGSPKNERYSVNTGWSAQRVFICDWEDRFTLIDQLRQYGVYPNQPGALISDITIEQIGDPVPTNAGTLEDAEFIDETLAYEKVRITVDYSNTATDTGQSGGGGGGSRPTNKELRNDGALFTYNVSGSQEAITIPSRGFEWVDFQEEKVREDVGVIVLHGVVEHHITISQLQAIPWDLLDSLCGKVNSHPLRLPITEILIAPENLIFDRYSTRMETPLGYAYENTELTWALDITLLERKIVGQYEYFTGTRAENQLGTFTGRTTYLTKTNADWRQIAADADPFNYTTTWYMPPGWNELYKPDGVLPGWTPIIAKDTGLPPIASADFNELIYGYKFDVTAMQSATGNTYMNELYPAKTIFVPA